MRNNTAPMHNMSLLFQSPFSLCSTGEHTCEALEKYLGQLMESLLDDRTKGSIKTFYKIALDYEAERL